MTRWCRIGSARARVHRVVAEEMHQSGRRVEYTLDDLLEWAESALGSPVMRSDRSWGHDSSLVLELRDRDGRRWFLKHPRDEGRFTRELSAFETVLHGFGDLVPELVGSNVPLRCLLFSEIPGELAQGGERAVDPEVHRQAGAFLARLHASTRPEPAPEMPDQLLKRRETMLRKAEGLIEPAQADFVRRATAALVAISDPVTVLCHLDYWHRNWMVDQDGTLRVFDFGQADRALVIQDLSLLAHHRWPSKPHLRDAFFDGYGRLLDDNEAAQLDGLVVMTALKRVMRSRKQGPQVLARARGLLAKMDPGAALA